MRFFLFEGDHPLMSTGGFPSIDLGMRDRQKAPGHSGKLYSTTIESGLAYHKAIRTNTKGGLDPASSLKRPFGLLGAGFAGSTLIRIVPKIIITCFAIIDPEYYSPFCFL